jgi:glycosyltransferase involved in cell wall biosynthesis
MKTFPQIGMRPISWAIRDWRRRLESPRPLALAISYPHYLPLRDFVAPDALIYYNMDDYGFYWSSQRDSVQSLEHRVVREAHLSVFCAKVRSEELRAAVPDAAERIIHLPHGAPSKAIAPAPQSCPAPAPPDIAHLPRPLLGFVGSLESRIDWGLIEHVAASFPEGSIILIGREPSPRPGEPWYRDYLRAVARPNVHRIGWKGQDDLGRYNASFDVCLIPYRTDHPFNRVACPTKIMDYMATSRPVVTTALPECRLYDHLFEVVESPAAFTAAVRNVVAQGSDDGRARLRWEAARAATWEQTSAAMLRHLRNVIPD